MRTTRGRPQLRVGRLIRPSEGHALVAAVADVRGGEAAVEQRPEEARLGDGRGRRVRRVRDRGRAGQVRVPVGVHVVVEARDGRRGVVGAHLELRDPAGEPGVRGRGLRAPLVDRERHRRVDDLERRGLVGVEGAGDDVVRPAGLPDVAAADQEDAVGLAEPVHASLPGVRGRGVDAVVDRVGGPGIVRVRAADGQEQGGQEHGTPPAQRLAQKCSFVKILSKAQAKFSA